MVKKKCSRDGLQYICKSCAKELNKKTSEKNQEIFNQIKDSLPGTKFCSGCNTEKPIKEFGKHKCCKDGLQYICKSCANKSRGIRLKNDPLYKLTCNIRTLVWSCLKNGGYKKNSKTAKILGCSFEFFFDWIEQHFTDGMSWDNEGEWHIDHFIPVSSGKTEEQVLKLNHYTNLRPLWGDLNGTKYNNHPVTINIDCNNKISIKPFLESDTKFIKEHRFDRLRENAPIIKFNKTIFDRFNKH